VAESAVGAGTGAAFGACSATGKSFKTDWLRGPRERAVSLELRKKNGAIVAVAYGFINRVEFNPSEGITLRCGQEKIFIKGRGLNAEIRSQIRLFQGIIRHRVPWIQEADPATLLRADKNAVSVLRRNSVV
jgi:hypothetical protein